MVTEGIFVPMDITHDSNGIFTPSKFYVHVEGGNATDTCVHLVGNGSRNGEYEQYKEQNTSIPVTTLTGKLNGQGESVVVFPDGMKKAGSVCDEIVIKNGKAVAVKRIDAVNLGGITWSYKNNGVFVAVISSLKNSGAAVCPIYEFGLYSYNQIASHDKTITTKVGYSDNAVTVCDTAYSDATTYKTAMNGVILYYELATPKEYILDDFQLPISIQADALGTEEQTIPSGVASAPATIGIKYAIDAVGFILNAPKNYISEQSMDNFLSQLGTAMNGTWTKTWNSTTNEWDFSFTPNVTPEENNG